MSISWLMRTACFAASVQLFFSAYSRADDSEIYLGETRTGTPYVMMTLDLRSSLFGKVGCVYGEPKDDGKTYCKTEWNAAPEIYQTLEEHNSTFGLGFADGEELSIFDAMRAIFGVVFEKYNGYYFGLMISHNGNAPGGAAYDSGGAYVLNGFQLFDETDSNHAKREILRKLYSIPEPPEGGPKT